MRHPLLAPDLRELVVERDEFSLREFFAGRHPAESAELLDDLHPDEVSFVLSLLAGRESAAVFAYLDAELQDGIAATMDRGQLASLLTYMSHDERADLVNRLPRERIEQIMPLLARAEREDIRLLASYREGFAAGAVMTSDYATLPAEETAAAAIERLRQEAPDKETIYYCYVVDDSRRLVGFVSLKDLILAPPSKRISAIMQTDVVSGRVDEDREVVARKLMEYDLIALPIVDSDDRLVGIVTHDDVIDVIVDEATEDVYRLGGVEPLAETYLRTGFFTLLGKRGFWLAILFVAGFFTTTVLGEYEELFNGYPALVLFLPLIISVGGNCGSQSATLITRALALGELTPADWFRVLWHEILMGASLGFTLGFVGFARAWLTPTSETMNANLITLSQVVAVSVSVVVICGNLIGAMLPLALKRMGLDSALMSNPVVASLMDVTGILVYFAIAQSLMPAMPV
ncbi:MAG TPA: magnesium transporter [Pirellulales bacterium]|jgi:magnesium transporter|nr:magnesium transporter [Pirellulales bacterium]HEX4145829.1 magnesium transporter [Pirellulales bacterium]